MKHTTRGDCSVCGRPALGLNKDGGIRRHWVVMVELRYEKCAGSNQSPKPGSVTAR